MKTNTSLVIGANGFLGSCLVDILLEKGQAVEGVYNVQKDRLRSDVINHPIASLTSLADTYKTVYLVGAYIPSTMKMVYDDVLLQSNVTLVNTVCNHFKNTRIVFASSVSVYKPTIDIINEDSPLGHVNAYAISKIWGETIVKNHSNYGIVRISSMYGAGMNKSTFLPAVIQAALDSNQITLFGDGMRLQNYIDVAVVANYLIAAANVYVNDVFLATAKENITNVNVAKKIAEILDTNVAIQFKGIDISSSFIYDNSKTRKCLDVENNCSFDSGLENLIAWMKK